MPLLVIRVTPGILKKYFTEYDFQNLLLCFKCQASKGGLGGGDMSTFSSVLPHATHSWQAREGNARSAKWHSVFISKKRLLAKAYATSSRGDPELLLLGPVISEPLLVTISDGATHGERT